MGHFTAESLREALKTRLRKQSLTPAEIESIADAATAELTLSVVTGATRRIDRDLLHPDRLYAVPDETLDLVPTLVRSTVAAFGKGPIAAIPDLVSLLLRYRRFRVQLTHDEGAVIRTLKRAHTEKRPPLPAADIEERLTREGFALKGKVGDVLAALKFKGNEKVTLVREAGGRWAIGNV